MVTEPSREFRRKVLVNEILIRKSPNFCKAFVGIDASQLYPFSICQPTPTELYTGHEIDKDLQRFKQKQNNTSGFENMLKSYFQLIGPDCKIECLYTTGKYWLFWCRLLLHALQQRVWLEPMGCSYHCCSCQEERLPLTEDIEKANGRNAKTIHKKRLRFLYKCGKVTGRHYTRQMRRWRNLRENRYLSRDCWEKNS